MRLAQQCLGCVVGIILVAGYVNEGQARSAKQVDVPLQVIQLTTKQEVSAHTDDLRTLMQQLYTEYPDELAKSTQVGPREMTEWVFDGKANWKFEGIRRLQGTDAISLVFDPAFTGDHILALVVGLETLVFTAYGSQNEFDIPLARDTQRLTHARCQLTSLQGRLQGDLPAGHVLSQVYASQQVMLTLQQLGQRLEKHTLNVCHHDERAC